MVNNMKNIVWSVILIIVGIALCVGSSVYLGYIFIKDKLPQETISQELETQKDNDLEKNNTDKPTKIIKPKSSHNKLMIIAHPDDDTIFGGAHLIQDDYTVVCVTCGVVDYRLKEFKNAMNYSNDKYKYLSHTDLEPNAHISDWVEEKDIINKELKQIIDEYDWNLIVAHNPDGEYGHKHHKMISEMVTNNVKNKEKLYYFGVFKEKGTIDDTPTLDEKIFKKKKEMLSLYRSQPSCTDKGKLTYAFDHENWVAYKDWKK